MRRLPMPDTWAQLRHWRDAMCPGIEKTNRTEGLDPNGPLLRHWGKYRQPPRRTLPGSIWLLIALSVVVGLGIAIWIAKRSQPWRPPSGKPRFVSCTYGGRV